MTTVLIVISFLCGKFWETHVRKEVSDWYKKFKGSV